MNKAQVIITIELAVDQFLKNLMKNKTTLLSTCKASGIGAVGKKEVSEASLKLRGFLENRILMSFKNLCFSDSEIKDEDVPFFSDVMDYIKTSVDILMKQGLFDLYQLYLMENENDQRESSSSKSNKRSS